MNDNTVMIIVAIVSGTLASVPGILALRGQYKKQSAEASSINVTTSLKLMKKLETRVDVLTLRLDAAEYRENEYVECLQQLIDQIEELGVMPKISRDDVNAIKMMQGVDSE